MFVWWRSRSSLLEKSKSLCGVRRAPRVGSTGGLWTSSVLLFQAQRASNRTKEYSSAHMAGGTRTWELGLRRRRRLGLGLGDLDFGVECLMWKPQVVWSFCSLKHASTRPGLPASSIQHPASSMEHGKPFEPMVRLMSPVASRRSPGRRNERAFYSKVT
jgi:hypothetical protein